MGVNRIHTRQRTKRVLRDFCKAKDISGSNLRRDVPGSLSHKIAVVATALRAEMEKQDKGA